jgi:hypothetical protein
MESKKTPVEKFGRDHWSTLLYIETRVVDHRGVLDNRNMRCNPKGRHPHFAHIPWEKDYPTRLAGGATRSKHDDWDCVEDLIAAGFLEWNGTGANPVFALTDEGWRVVSALRRHRAEGAGVATFVYKPLVTPASTSEPARAQA